jgi:hypothetical protein
MLMTIFAFLGGPVAQALVGAYREKLKANSNDKVTAATLAGTEIGAQQAETNAIYNLRIAQIGHPWEPEKLAFYVTLVFYAKVMIWDKVLGNITGGHTDEVTGAAGVWAGLIMSFYFAKRGFENVARILKR